LEDADWLQQGTEATDAEALMDALALLEQQILGLA